jgi:hypothetical protein
MKTWVYICATILAAGVVTVSAQTTAGTPAHTNEVAAPPPASAPTPAPAPATPAPPKVTPPPRTAPAPAPTPAPAPAPVPVPVPAPESPGTGHKASATNVPPPVAAEEVKPPEAEPVMSTNAVPAEGADTNAPPANTTPSAESSGIGHWSALLIGAAILLVGGGIGFFIWSKSAVVHHGSLITSAMNELKKNPPSEEKDEDKVIEPPADKPVEPREEKKKLEIKFPPPMT